MNLTIKVTFLLGTGSEIENGHSFGLISKAGGGSTIADPHHVAVHKLEEVVDAPSRCWHRELVAGEHGFAIRSWVDEPKMILSQVVLVGHPDFKLLSSMELMLDLERWL